MKPKFTWMVTSTLLTALLAGCTNSVNSPTLLPKEKEPQTETVIPVHKTALPAAGEPFDFEVDPATFALTIIKDGVREQASLPLG